MCERGLHVCPEAHRLWLAYRAAADIEGALFDAVTGIGEDDPIMYDRWRLAGEVKRQALRQYEKHVDEASEPIPHPQSLKVVE